MDDRFPPKARARFGQTGFPLLAHSSRSAIDRCTAITGPSLDSRYPPLSAFTQGRDPYYM
jgi:hypothetical protein